MIGAALRLTAQGQRIAVHRQRPTPRAGATSRKDAAVLVGDVNRELRSFTHRTYLTDSAEAGTWTGDVDGGRGRGT